MVLRAIECRGYKGFRLQTRLPLHRITVLFGKNNSGKTTLARLPIFAAASFSNPETMYALAHNGLTFGSTFAELASVDQPHPQISFGIEWSRRNRINVTLQHIVSSKRGDTVQPTAVEVDGNIKIAIPLRSGKVESAYDVFLPGMSPAQRGQFSDRVEAARTLLAETIHIPSARPRIEETYTSRPPAGRTVDEVPYLLSSQRNLLADVDDWFQSEFDGASIGVDQAAFAFQLSESRASLPVNLSASGRGLQAIIPVVSLLKDTIQSRRRTQLIVLEEPEAHLHPSLHGVMADLIITCSRHSQVIVETHSENFILRLRRRIAEKRIRHTAVGLYYLDDARNVQQIKIDEFGTINNWPAGVFESDIEEARAIVEAKLRAMSQLGGAK